MNKEITKGKHFCTILRMTLPGLLWMILGNSRVPAQYQVFDWENFESGTIPPTLVRMFNATTENVTVFDYTSPDAPPGIRDGAAASECGRYGIKFQTGEKDRFLTLMSTISLDRGKLGERGKALYQADYFIPAKNVGIPTMAVLAASGKVEEGASTWQIYRLGVIGGKRLFFSFTNNKPEPALYENDALSSYSLQLPGWHRIQIIFEGQENIICAIDGKQSSFSPLRENTFQTLQAGLMVTSTPDKPSVCYADNLSIQYTPEDLPLPDSPWAMPSPSPTLSVARRQQPGIPSLSSAMDSQPMLHWYTNPDEAWNECVAKKRPMILLLYAPRANAYARLDQIIAADPNAQSMLRQFVLARTDVNQLSGGALAKKFLVFKVPCFLLFSPDSMDERGRVIFKPDMEWSVVDAELRKLVKTP